MALDPTEVALLAFAGGSLMAAAISAFVTHLVFHPVISVRLDEKKGSHGPVTIYHRDQGGRIIGTSPAKFFRLHIENTGLSSIKACSGFITKLTKRAGGQQTASEEEVVSLGWASYGQGDARDIPRGAFLHMDIATLDLDPATRRSTLRVDRVSSSLENFFKDNATYTFKILVASDNARPNWITVEFAFDSASERLAFEPVDSSRHPWWKWWLLLESPR